MKLEVGMYVRTEFGIGSYIKDYTNSQGLTWRVLEGCYNLDNQEDFATLFCDCEIIKASHNIIDLIEVGDYVNGKLVNSLPLFKNEFIYGEAVNGVKYIKGIVGTPIEDNKDNFIKTIVTKEQFESMSYKVGD